MFVAFRVTHALLVNKRYVVCGPGLPPSTPPSQPGISEGCFNGALASFNAGAGEGYKKWRRGEERGGEGRRGEGGLTPLTRPGRTDGQSGRPWSRVSLFMGPIYIGRRRIIVVRFSHPSNCGTVAEMRNRTITRGAEAAAAR